MCDPVTGTRVSSFDLENTQILDTHISIRKEHHFTTFSRVVYFANCHNSFLRKLILWILHDKGHNHPSLAAV